MTTSSADRSSPAAPAVWEFVAPAEHRVPAARVEQTVKSGLATLWERLRPRPAQVDEPLTRDEVEALSDARLQALAPEPPWVDAAGALDVALQGWLDRPTDAPHAVVTLGHPHGGHTSVLRAWAARRGWRLVRAPDAHEILGAHAEWLNELRGDGSPWVLPALEHGFLRHVDGLALVRTVLDGICAGKLGHGLIGCDTWAWNFLRHQWHGQGFPTLVARAFDGDRLAAWFAGLASGGVRTNFREAVTGRYLWPPEGRDDVPISEYLQSLAVHSRGIPGVAWATWRRSLVGTSREPDPGSGGAVVSTVLVRAWAELRDLSVPTDNVREAGLVLQALLVHGGLPLDILPLVIPLPADEIAEVVSRLAGAELVTCTGRRCEVSALGYPAVRKFVVGRGFATD